MRRFALLFLLTAGCADHVPLTCGDDTLPGDASIKAYRVNDRFVVDGDFAEWSDVPRHALQRSPLPRQSPQDLSATFAIAWDDTRLYVAVDVRDDVLTAPDSDVNYWAEDGVEAFIDMTPSDATAYDGDSEMHFYMRQPGIAMRTTALPLTPWDGSAVFVATDPPHWSFELGIDWPERFASIPRPGATIGFDVAVNDDDTPTAGIADDREGQLFWSSVTGLASTDPSQLGRVVLDDCELGK